MITAGLDVGAKTVKVVIVKDGDIIGKGIATSGLEAQEAVDQAWAKALGDAGITRENIEKIAGTGARRQEVTSNGYDFETSDVIAVATAVKKIDPEVKTVLDVGAEEGRAIKVDANGKVSDFAVNEKCAAGAGAFIEAMARAMQVSIQEFGAMSLESIKKIHINAQCAVFAESEVVSLVHDETGRPDICKAVLDAIADRLAAMARRIMVEPKVALVGGTAHSAGLRRSMELALGLDGLFVPENPEFIGAYGAALVAANG